MKPSAKPRLAKAQRPPSDVTRDRYLVWRAPRLGATNPHRMTNPVWAWLARQRELNAYMANRHFDGPSSLEAGPAWCGQRFGQSRTELADGRVVYVGGEHEDYYDPDFFIYNDVIVEAPDGATEIYGYPWEALGPTDFHSATLHGDRVVVVGALDYAWRRAPGLTRVAAIDTRSWSAQTWVTREGPGWIYDHRAALEPDGRGLRVEGGFVERDDVVRVEQRDVWRLDLDRLTWACVERRASSQWSIARADGKRLRLFDLGLLRWHRDDASDFGRERRARYQSQHGVAPDFAAWEARYALDCDHEPVEAAGDDELAVTRLRVEGVTVRYVEESFAVRVVIEGEPSEAARAAAIDGPRRALERIEGAACVARQLA